MNTKRFLLAVAAAVIFTFVTDFLIHAVWLDPVYKEAGILRPESEAMARFPWMVAGHVLLGFAFVLLWARHLASDSVMSGAVYGFWMGVFQQVGTIFLFVSMPIPARIAISWFVAGVVQAAVLGAITAAIYRPATARPDLSSLD